MGHVILMEIGFQLIYSMENPAPPGSGQQSDSPTLDLTGPHPHFLLHHMNTMSSSQWTQFLLMNICAGSGLWLWSHWLIIISEITLRRIICTTSIRVIFQFWLSSNNDGSMTPLCRYKILSSAISSLTHTLSLSHTHTLCM